MKPLLIAALAAALALPAATASAAPAHNIVVAQRDRGHRDHYDWGRDNRNPDAWREHNPGAFAGHPHWSRGDRLYRQYWGPNYYVTDWRTHHLRRPPRGYRWVEVDGDYLLVAITTGIIMDMMLDQMHEDRYDDHRHY